MPARGARGTGRGQPGAFRPLDAFAGWTTHDGAPADGSELPARLGQVYATAFQLLNLIEENVSAQVRREREKAAGPAAEPGLWGANLERLRHAGLHAAEIAAGLARIVVEPVLTAHPTEAKRPTALEQHRRLFSSAAARAKTRARRRSNWPTGARKSR